MAFLDPENPSFEPGNVLIIHDAAESSTMGTSDCLSYEDYYSVHENLDYYNPRHKRNLFGLKEASASAYQKGVKECICGGGYIARRSCECLEIPAAGLVLATGGLNTVTLPGDFPPYEDFDIVQRINPVVDAVVEMFNSIADGVFPFPYRALDFSEFRSPCDLVNAPYDPDELDPEVGSVDYSGLFIQRKEFDCPDAPCGESEDTTYIVYAFRRFAFGQVAHNIDDLGVCRVSGGGFNTGYYVSAVPRCGEEWSNMDLVNSAFTSNAVCLLSASARYVQSLWEPKDAMVSEVPGWTVDDGSGGAIISNGDGSIPSWSYILPTPWPETASVFPLS